MATIADIMNKNVIGQNNDINITGLSNIIQKEIHDRNMFEQHRYMVNTETRQPKSDRNIKVL